MIAALDKGLAAVADRSIAADIEFLAQEAFFAGHKASKITESSPYDGFMDFWDHARANPDHAAVFAIKDEAGQEADTTAATRIDRALSIALMYGGIDGAHHKAWVIDQIMRCLMGADYATFVANAKAGEDGPETYEWDEGIAP